MSAHVHACLLHVQMRWEECEGGTVIHLTSSIGKYRLWEQKWTIWELSTLKITFPWILIGPKREKWTLRTMMRRTNYTLTLSTYQNRMQNKYILEKHMCCRDIRKGGKRKESKLWTLHLSGFGIYYWYDSTKLFKLYFASKLWRRKNSIDEVKGKKRLIKKWKIKKGFHFFSFFTLRE